MNTPLERNLEKLGLSEKEAKVYLATLELGQATVQHIAKKAEVQRPTTYVILDSLMKNGLVTTAESGKKTLFSAESPEQLDRLLEKEKADIALKHTYLQEIIPELKALFNLTENRPKVKFYEGKEGIIAMQEEFLRLAETVTEEIVGFTPLDELLRVFPNYESTYSKERSNKKLRNKVIYTRAEGPLTGATSENVLREARYIPKDKFPFTSSVTVYGQDYLVLISYGEQLLGVTIQSNDIASSFRVIFNLAWDAAEQYNQ
ncbi:MAG: TrmB family transcriptional regulator [Patescibacteria group bacterium]|nr:TrmB family transcriptional regulator [Patescibacteria group bacterium]MDE2438481.1 TrmB family transcriptional regulator [Patescibacteria group bacterium]